MLKYLAFLPVASALSPACEHDLSELQCVKTCDTYTKQLGYTRGDQPCSESIAEVYINRQCCSCDNANSLVHDPNGGEEYVEPVCGDVPVYPLESAYANSYAGAALGGFDAGWVKRPEAASFYLLWNNFVANPQGVNLVAPSLANKLLLDADRRSTVNGNPSAYPYAHSLSTHPDDDEKYNELMTMTLGDLDVLRVKICDTGTRTLEEIVTPGDIIVNVYTAYDGSTACTGTWYCSRHDYVAQQFHKVGQCADIVVPLGNVDHPNIMRDSTNGVVETATTGVDYTSKTLLAVALNSDSSSSNKPVYKLKSYEVNDIEVKLI